MDEGPFVSIHIFLLFGNATFAIFNRITTFNYSKIRFVKYDEDVVIFFIIIKNRGLQILSYIVFRGYFPQTGIFRGFSFKRRAAKLRLAF